MTNKWEKRFFFNIGTECTHVPNLLLINFRQLGLKETELVFLIQLLMINCNATHSIQELSALLKMEEAIVKQNLANLIEKGFIVTENIQEAGQIIPGYFLDGLYDKLIDIWACEMASKTEIATAVEIKHPALDQKFSAVFSVIEKEFGRPLTGIENDKIKEWLEPLGYSPEIIFEALKRAVLRGVYNLNYIDRILLDWQKSNIRTVHEVVSYEKFKMGKEKKPIKKSTYVKSTSRNLDDLYEL